MKGVGPEPEATPLSWAHESRGYRLIMKGVYGLIEGGSHAYHHTYPSVLGAWRSL
jgi:hypothetical protein